MMLASRYQSRQTLEVYPSSDSTILAEAVPLGEWLRIWQACACQSVHSDLQRSQHQDYVPTLGAWPH